MSGMRGQDDNPGATDDVDLDALIGEEPDDPETGTDEETEDAAPESEAEGEDAPETGGTLQPRQEQKRPSRAETRIRNLTREIEEERRQRQALEQQISQLRTPVAAVPDPRIEREREQAELERVQMMMPHEVAAYYARKAEESVNQRLLQGQLETRDMLDRISFTALQREDALARRLAARVEDTLTEARKQGMNPTREAILNLLVGQEIREKARKQIETQRRQGRRQIAAQTTVPAQTRSTAASERRRQDDNSIEAIEKRLENVTL